MSLLSDFGLGYAGEWLQNRFASNQADASRGWQQMMAQNQHQFEVKDLEAAGLNPMLSAMHSGFSVPGAVVGQPGGMSITQGAQESSASQLTSAQAANQKAQGELYQAQADKTRSEIGVEAAGQQSQGRVNDATVAKYAQDIKSSASSAAQADAQTEVLKKNLGLVQAQIDQLGSATSLNRAKQGTEYAQQGALDASRGLDVEDLATKKATAKYIIDMVKTDANLKQLMIGGAANEAAFHNSAWGRMLDAVGLNANDVVKGAGLVVGGVAAGRGGSRGPSGVVKMPDGSLMNRGTGELTGSRYGR